jgi:hypothetical protein
MSLSSDHQTGRRLDQPGRDPNILGAIPECLLEAIEHGFERGSEASSACFFSLLVLQRAQVDRALGHALQRLAVELVQVR